jgi:hypothetical protein
MQQEIKNVNQLKKFPSYVETRWGTRLKVFEILHILWMMYREYGRF